MYVTPSVTGTSWISVKTPPVLYEILTVPILLEFDHVQCIAVLFEWAGTFCPVTGSVTSIIGLIENVVFDVSLT